MKTNSKTLREFSIRVTDKNGNKHIICYGYDTSGKHSGHYINLSTNGSPATSNKSAISKLISLKIPAITRLISSLDRDVTGTPRNFDITSKEICDKVIADENNANLWDSIVEYYRITTQKEEIQLASMLEKYGSASEKSKVNILNRYNKSRRVAFINEEKELIKDLRKLYMNGAIVDGKKNIVKFEGELKKTHYPYYYKRDIDYVRKARVKVYERVLNASYIPYEASESTED